MILHPILNFFGKLQNIKNLVHINYKKKVS